MIGAVMLLLGTLSIGQGTAGAAEGDMSNAEGEFLSGTLLGSDLDLLADLEAAKTSSDGVTEEIERNNLDLSLLGEQVIELPGGIQVPLELAGAGVVGQYARASADGSSLGSSGLIQSDGTIGTGEPDDDDDEPGPLSLQLSGVVSELDLDSELVELLPLVAELSLEANGVSVQASQAAPDAAVGDYHIDELTLRFQSLALMVLLDELMGEFDTQLGEAQDQLDDLEGQLDAGLLSVLNLLPGGIAAVDLQVTPPDLATVVEGLLEGPIMHDDYPGIFIDLSSGQVVIDLDELTELNDLPPNTDILTEETITAITSNLTGLLTNHLAIMEADLFEELDATAITGVATLAGVDILNIDTSVGAVRAGDTSGIEVLDDLLPAGLAGDVVTALLGPITEVVDTLQALDPATDGVLAPVLAALTTVLDELLAITVNNQSTSDGVFTETALRITLLPSAAALTLDLATGRVGPNSLAEPAPPTTEPAPSSPSDAPSSPDDGPVPTTAVVVSPPAPAPVVAVPAAPAAPVAAAAPAPGGNLARTGIEPGKFILAGLMLSLLGAGMLAVNRRRRGSL